MNFNIVTEKGKGKMTYDKATDIRPNVYLSLNIVKQSDRNKGSWQMFPDFGLDMSNIKQVTTQTVDLLEQEIEKSLAWMIDAGIATTINVTTEMDLQDRNRINAEIEIIQLNQIPMIFVAFVCVGGPSPEFVVT